MDGVCRVLGCAYSGTVFTMVIARAMQKPTSGRKRRRTQPPAAILVRQTAAVPSPTRQEWARSRAGSAHGLICMHARIQRRRPHKERGQGARAGWGKGAGNGEAGKQGAGGGECIFQSAAVIRQIAFTMHTHTHTHLCRQHAPAGMQHRHTRMKNRCRQNARTHARTHTCTHACIHTPHATHAQHTHIHPTGVSAIRIP